jgi:2,4-dienoyl-CoA reductase-like NADH-dependent reductase (Old Yellow Enzyme family)
MKRDSSIFLNLNAKSAVTMQSNLFDQFHISGHAVSSRIVLAPINTGFAIFGHPTPRLLRFHENRSGFGIGICMVGNVALSRGSVTNAGTLELLDQSDISKFANLARCILQRGSLPGIQLGFSPEGLAPSKRWVAKDKGGELARLTAFVLAFSDEYLSKIIDAFASTATLAAKADFRVIQIHAAHGYLLSLLLNPLTNRRTGDFRLRGPWLSRLIESVQTAIHSRLLSVRLSLSSGLLDDNSEEIASISELSRGLAHAGVHILDFSNGFYTVDKRLIYPGIEKGVLPSYEIVRTLSAGLNCMISVVGNVSDLHDVPITGDKMLISVGRALIADSDFVKKSRIGNVAAVVRCKRTGKCHYFSRGKSSIECGVNPELVRVSSS